MGVILLDGVSRCKQTDLETNPLSLCVNTIELPDFWGLIGTPIFIEVQLLRRETSCATSFLIIFILKSLILYYLFLTIFVLFYSLYLFSVVLFFSVRWRCPWY